MRAKSINEENFEKGQDPKRAMGIGDLGKTDKFKAMDALTHFLYYVDAMFIENIWGDNDMFAKHLRHKLYRAMENENVDYLAPQALLRFMRELDTQNERMLFDYILENHTDKW